MRRPAAPTPHTQTQHTSHIICLRDIPHCVILFKILKLNNRVSASYTIHTYVINCIYCVCVLVKYTRHRAAAYECFYMQWYWCGGRRMYAYILRFLRVASYMNLSITLKIMLSRMHAYFTFYTSRRVVHVHT